MTHYPYLHCSLCRAPMRSAEAERAGRAVACTPCPVADLAGLWIKPCAPTAGQALGAQSSEMRVSP